ncbi:MAG: nitronate monooxygenase [Alphaproteobacteria bacterium]|nr:nitronate monooxygenase [Alphaproteobacteria bacterium]
MKELRLLNLCGKNVFPLFEGGRGVNVSNGHTAGAWAKENCVGTFSGVFPDVRDECGNLKTPEILAKSRNERHAEMMDKAVEGCVTQAQIAHEVSGGNGLINMNVLWELADSQYLIKNVLEKAKGLINGVVSGAGLPIKLAELTSQFNVFYYPIVSSGRALQILIKRGYDKYKEFMGGVVYEDPWFAGGHCGFSNTDEVSKPQSPYEKVVEIRKVLNANGLNEVPIIIAGGVWSLSDWQDYIDNPEIGNVGFQFGTRPLLTKESPISQAWKKLLTTLDLGDVVIQDFSPTGFLSSAIKNSLIMKLFDRTEKQIPYSKEQNAEFSEPISYSKNTTYYIRKQDLAIVEQQKNKGYCCLSATPDNTLVFLTKVEKAQAVEDIRECCGCLSACKFSSWSSHTGTTGKLPDLRSFCIRKSLIEVGHKGNILDNILFSGKNAFKFKDDPLFKGANWPSVKELIEAIKKGL